MEPSRLTVAFIIALFNYKKMQGDNALSAISERVYQLMTVSQVNEPQFTVALANELACSRFRVDHFAQLLFEFASSMQSLELFDENSSYIRFASNYLISCHVLLSFSTFFYFYFYYYYYYY